MRMNKVLMAGLLALFACNTAQAYVLDCDGTIFADDSYRIPATVKSDAMKKMIGRMFFDSNKVVTPQSFALDLTVPIDTSNTDSLKNLVQNIQGLQSVQFYKPKKEISPTEYLYEYQPTADEQKQIEQAKKRMNRRDRRDAQDAEGMGLGWLDLMKATRQLVINRADLTAKFGDRGTKTCKMIDPEVVANYLDDFNSATEAMAAQKAAAEQEKAKSNKF